MRLGSKPSTPTALRGATSLQVLEGLLQEYFEWKKGSRGRREWRNTSKEYLFQLLV